MKGRTRAMVEPWNLTKGLSGMNIVLVPVLVGLSKSHLHSQEINSRFVGSVSFRFVSRP